MDRTILLDKLSNCPLGTFNKVVGYLNPPSGTLSSKYSDQATLATELLQWAENEGLGLKRVEECYQQAIEPSIPPPRPHSSRIWIVLVSAAVAIVVVVVRVSGGLQSAELIAYDQLMRFRLSEGQDQKIFVVGIESQRIEDKKIKTSELTNLLKDINQHKPAVIGVDIYREWIDTPEHNDFVKYLKDHRNIIVPCSFKPQNVALTEGNVPPFSLNDLKVNPKLSELQLGFINTVEDSDDFIRRQLLAAPLYPSQESSCAASKSLSLQLARRYLWDKNSIELKEIEGKYLQFGETSFKANTLEKHWGGYQGKGYTEFGHQIMLNYRSNESEMKSFQTLNVCKSEPSKVKICDDNSTTLISKIEGNIVLIGYIDEEKKDENPDIHKTIYDTRKNSFTPGVFIHAHMISQIVNAVLPEQRRPLIWTFSEGYTVLWILGWSGLGGIAVWKWRLLQLCVAILSAVVLLLAFCFMMFYIWGAWVPLVPSFLAFILVIIIVSFAIKYIRSPIL